MNKILIAGLLLTSTVGVQAQTLKDAKKKVENERFDLARKDFQTLIQKDPMSIDNAFFYGNFLVTMEENDAAIEQFKSAASKNAEDKLAMVSGAKATYFSGDTTAAGIKFREIIKATKSKNACVYLRIAETYVTGPKKNLPVAETYLNKVIALEPTNVEAMQLLGDIIIEQSTSRVSQAVEQYNNVLKIEPTNVSASVKKARIYERVKNKEAALQGYEAAEKIDPTFGPAFRYHAELAMKEGQYDKAAQLWTKYLEINDAVDARYRYAASLYVGKKYPESLTEMQKVEKNGLVNHYTKRIIFYATYESNTAKDSLKYLDALRASTDFFNLAKQDQILASDYDYLAKTNMALKNSPAAFDAWSKAAKLDPALAATGIGQIGSAAYKARNYQAVVEAYTKKLEIAPTSMSPTEWFELGKSYYFEPNKNYVMADTSFAQVSLLSASYAPAYLWRGRALSAMDTDMKNRNWKAQPYYEMYLSKLTEEAKKDPANAENLTEANRYLGDYYVNSPAKDNAKAKIYWQQVLALNPTDAQAKQVLSKF